MSKKCLPALSSGHKSSLYKDVTRRGILRSATICGLASGLSFMGSSAALAHNIPISTDAPLSRRMTAPSAVLASRLGRGRRYLSIHAITLGERLNINYFRNAQYDYGALAELDNLFRDPSTGDTAEIDAGLYDQLAAISLNYERREIALIKGYKTLHEDVEGLEQTDFHNLGQAADFYIGSTSIADTHITTLQLTAGGVGYYPEQNYVHIDTGPLRNWPSKYESFGQQHRLE